MESLTGSSDQVWDLLQQVPFLRGRTIYSLRGVYRRTGLYFSITVDSEEGPFDTKNEYYRCVLEDLATVNELINNGTPTLDTCFRINPSEFVTAQVCFEYKSLDFLAKLLLCTERVDEIPEYPVEYPVEYLVEEEPVEFEEGDTP